MLHANTNHISFLEEILRIGKSQILKFGILTWWWYLLVIYGTWFSLNIIADCGWVYHQLIWVVQSVYVLIVYAKVNEIIKIWWNEILFGWNSYVCYGCMYHDCVICGNSNLVREPVWKWNKQKNYLQTLPFWNFNNCTFKYTDLVKYLHICITGSDSTGDKGDIFISSFFFPFFPSLSLKHEWWKKQKDKVLCKVVKNDNFLRG